MNTAPGKLQRSWQLFQRSVRVIQEHPKLLVFPVVTGVLTIGIVIFFLVPVALVLLAPHWIEGSTIRAVADSIGFVRVRDGAGFGAEVHPLGTVILAGLYLVDLFLATLGSVAFSSEILEALSRRPVSIRRGIQTGCRRWKAVLLWSLLAGTVGLIIRALEERLPLLGRLVVGLIGLAWSVASLFAIPILVREPSLANPIAVLSRSAATLKRTWGEMLAGYIGMQGTNLLFLGVSLVFWVLAGLGAYLVSNAWLLLVAGFLWIAALVAYGYLAAIASRVYLCALYLYATEGVVSGHFDEAMMGMAWKLKKVAR